MSFVNTVLFTYVFKCCYGQLHNCLWKYELSGVDHKAFGIVFLLHLFSQVTNLRQVIHPKQLLYGSGSLSYTVCMF